MRVLHEIESYFDTLHSLGLQNDRRVRIRQLSEKECMVVLPDDHPDFETLKETLVTKSRSQRVWMRFPEFTAADVRGCAYAIAVVKMPSGYIPDAVRFPPGICKECGAGKADLDAVRITKPKSVKKDFLAPHASEDLLCRTTIWEKFLQPIGVDARPVYSPSGSTLIEDVVQLYSEEFVSVTKPGFVHTVCSTCGESIVDREAFVGWSPTPVWKPTGPIFRAAEWSGYESVRRRDWYVTHEFIEVVLRNKLTNIEFLPCDPSVVTRER